MQATKARPVSDPSRNLLRHTLATLSYRGGKTLRSAPDSFAKFQIAQGSRTPEQILAHIGDLFDWALSPAKGKQTWHNSQPLAWPREIERFFHVLEEFDQYLAGDHPLAASPEQLFQGPVADALTHVGQLAFLRRLAGIPMKAENYFAAKIVVGRVGAEQAAAVREFD
jgi:hypothetical protein